MNEITWESVIAKLGFDPREGLKYKYNKNDWAVDDSKPNPYAVLTEEKRQSLMDNWIGPQLHKTTVA